MSLLSQQYSLVPILTIVAIDPHMNNRPKWLKKMANLRILIVSVFALWLVPLFILPIFYDQMRTLFLVGDISLFMYIMISPPEYKDTTFIILATYAVLTSLIGIFIVFRLVHPNFNRSEVTSETHRV